MFQLQQREVLSPWCRFSMIATLPIPWIEFHAPLNPNTHLASMFENTICPIYQLWRHITKNKWGSAKLMDIYHVVGITAVLYPRFGTLINIVSKKDITYCVIIGKIPYCTCLDFTKIPSRYSQKKGKRVYCNHSYYVFRFLLKVDYDGDKFIHTPTCFYNEVIQLLEFTSVVKWEIY